MLQRFVCRIIEAARARGWPRPLGLLALLAVACGAVKKLCEGIPKRAKARAGALARKAARLPRQPVRRALAGALAACLMLALLPAPALAALHNLGEMEPNADAPTPTVNVSSKQIYANGVPLLLVAGSSDSSKTVIYIDKGTIGQLDEGTDEIFDPDGSEATYDGTAAGNDLSKWGIYGGGLNQNVTSTQITMTGGKISSIYGGGNGLASGGSANVTGNTSVKISGGIVSSSIFAGGGAYGNASANVTGNAKLEITGGEIGSWVYGGGIATDGNSSAAVGGNSTVSISGNAVLSDDVFGGGYANSYSASNVKSDVTGAATVTISGNAEVRGSVYPSGHLYDVNNNFAVHSDNSGNSATVGDGSSVTVGGGVKIGGSTAGIVINGGGPTEFKTGVASFAIDSDLTGADGSVNVVLPAGYDVSTTPTIATGAVEADLAKIKLVGGGAEGNEAYFENNEIKVKAKAPAHTHAMSVDCSATEGTQVAFDKALTSQNGKLHIDGTVADSGRLPAGSYYLADDVELDGCINIPGTSAPTVNLCLNGHKLAYAGSAKKENAIQIASNATLNLCDCGGSGGSHTIISRATNESVTVTGGVVTGATGSAIEVFWNDSTLHLYGGTLAGNGGTSAGSGGDTVYGGGVLNLGTFVMHGGAICHNLGGYGGGVYSSGSLTIAGGKISNNRAKSAAGGVSVNYQSGSSLTLSGAPVISDSVAGEEQATATANNLRLPQWFCATVENGFAPTTKIGITTVTAPTEGNTVSITGTNDKNYSSYFTSDDPAYVIQNGPDNVVQLALPKSTDATLSALTYKVGGGTETTMPNFASGTDSYNVELPYDTAADAAITLTGTPATGAIITENNGVTLSGGSGEATITVTADYWCTT